jgi:hypothetical protein
MTKREIYGISSLFFLCTAVMGILLFLLLRKEFAGQTPTQATPQSATTTQPAPVNSSVSFSKPLRKSFSKKITIPANEMWVDTGIDVTGKRIRIEYESGQWTNMIGSNSCDGEGKGPYPHLTVPDAPLAALVGKTDTGSFYVGNLLEGNMGKGRLYLGLNDKADFYDDNSGALNVTVSFVE